MKLQKALKVKKSLVGEIATLQRLIQQKNSFIDGTVNIDFFNVPKLYEQLEDKISQLVSLKMIINTANEQIQSKIYMISEYKSLISFWNGLSTVSGVQYQNGYAAANIERIYVAQFDELYKIEKIKDLQEKIDKLQEDIDSYNHNIDIPWGVNPDDERLEA